MLGDGKPFQHRGPGGEAIETNPNQIGLQYGPTGLNPLLSISDGSLSSPDQSVRSIVKDV